MTALSTKMGSALALSLIAPAFRSTREDGLDWTRDLMSREPTRASRTTH